MDNEKLLPYQKVSCDFYDEIETYAALRKKVIITYQKQSEDLVLKSTIKGLKTTKEKEEFLILPDNTMIRLDHVVRILEV